MSFVEQSVLPLLLSQSAMAATSVVRAIALKRIKEFNFKKL